MKLLVNLSLARIAFFQAAIRRSTGQQSGIRGA
jgi:hypothetical protein